MSAGKLQLTDAQRVLLEDKFVLWDRAARHGPTDVRDYNGRAAEALKVALAIASEGARDWSEFEDEIAEVIQDSLDADWTARDGARAVVRFLNELAGRKALEAGRGG